MTMKPVGFKSVLSFNMLHLNEEGTFSERRKIACELLESVDSGILVQMFAEKSNTQILSDLKTVKWYQFQEDFC